MPVNRFFIDTSFNDHQKINISDAEFHHLVHVVRSQPGDQIELINGRGQLAQGTITHIEKKQCSVEITTVINQQKPEFEIILVQGIPRMNRLDNILEKGTELGMTQLWLLSTTTSEKKQITPSQIEKMKSQMIAAIKQCGRLYLPEITFTTTLKEYTTLPYQSFYGDINESAPNFLSKFNKNTKGVIFFVGPESGFTDEEIECLKRLGACGVSLNQNILRTDTAAIAALAAIGCAKF